MIAIVNEITGFTDKATEKEIGNHVKIISEKKN